jgi:hypothetical protein
MSNQNAKKAIFKTPVGVAQYPWLNSPDTQFDTAGQYKVNLRLSPEDAKPLMEEVREAAKAAFGEKAKSATMPFVQDADTGEYIFKTKSRYQPKACDSTGKVIPTGQLPQIFGGSEMSLAGTLFPYQAGGRHGISMQLGAVQLVKLSESSNTAGIQFAAVEGGYVAAASNDNAVNDNAAPTEEAEGSYNF